MIAKKPAATSPDYALYAKAVVEHHHKASGEVAHSKAGLSVVATPLGNLGDITLRALVALSTADRILCEDTRVTGGLLQRYGIKCPMVSLHDHNETDRITEILGMLAKGEALALVSDAGMPLIADPGFKLVRAVRAAGFDVTVLPGASAFVTALAGSGLPTDCFSFCGFIPNKAKARQDWLQAASAGFVASSSPSPQPATRSTLIFYETAPRLAASLAAMVAVFGDAREAVVARELTKLYEDYRSGTLAELAAHYVEHDTKGEIVILVAGTKEDAASTVSDQQLEILLTKALATQSLRDAVEAVSQATGVKKKLVYQLALRLTEKR